VSAILPLLGRVARYPQIGLVDQGRSLQRVRWILLVHVPSGHLVQLRVNHRHELFERSMIPAAPLDEQLRDPLRRRRHDRGRCQTDKVYHRRKANAFQTKYPTFSVDFSLFASNFSCARVPLGETPTDEFYVFGGEGKRLRLDVVVVATRPVCLHDASR
jgi:hypothetical protein